MPNSKKTKQLHVEYLQHNEMKVCHSGKHIYQGIVVFLHVHSHIFNQWGVSLCHCRAVFQ